MLNESGLAAKGTPNTYGYDANGDRFPYANHRPPYAANQVEDVWNATREYQLENHEEMGLEKPGEDQVWVRVRDGETGPGIVHVPYEGEWRLVTWRPGESRTGKWDMGHAEGLEYAKDRFAYLNHEISLEEFLKRYQNSNRYEVSDPGRNRGHDDEAS